MGLLAVYVAVIAPTVVQLFVEDVVAFLLSQVAVAMVEILLFLIFAYVILLPITETLRDVQTSQVEIFLAAPIKPSDVLLGEFVGVMPFYAIAITVIAGLFTAVLQPLGLHFMQVVMIVLVFVVIVLSALWIGTVFAAVLRTRLGRVARGRDVGRGLSVVLVLPLIALMYAIMGGGLLEALADPSTSGVVKAVLGLLPSSWGAEIIVGFAVHPGTVGAISFETVTRFGGLLAFFGATLWLGAKAAGRAYRLEPTAFTASRVKPDGVFYKGVKSLGGGGPFGTLLVSTVKDYSRRFENLSWLLYAMGLTALVGIFFGDPSSGPEDPLLTLSVLMSPLLSGLALGTVSRGKEQLFLYKKSPSGMGRFVRARALQGWLVAVPIAAGAMTVSTILVPQITFGSVVMNVLLGSLRTAANVALLLGLVLLIPNFTEESRARMLSIMINLQIAVFSTIGLEIGLPRLGLSFRQMFPDLNRAVGLLYDHLLHTTILALVGVVLLYLGTRKMSQIE